MKQKFNSKYLTVYLDKIFRSLVLILAKMSGYVENVKVKPKIHGVSEGSFFWEGVNLIPHFTFQRELIQYQYIL